MPYKPVPKSARWAMRIYVTGYWLYVIVAAAWAWFQIPTFGLWAYYTVFQFVYAFFWPILVPLSLLGIQW